MPYNCPVSNIPPSTVSAHFTTKSLTGRLVVSINSQRLAEEVLDEKRFHKKIAGGLEEVRTLVGDGLFTAYHGEPNWGIARELRSPISLRDCR